MNSFAIVNRYKQSTFVRWKHLKNMIIFFLVCSFLCFSLICIAKNIFDVLLLFASGVYFLILSICNFGFLRMEKCYDNNFNDKGECIRK